MKFGNVPELMAGTGARVVGGSERRRSAKRSRRRRSRRKKSNLRENCISADATVFIVRPRSSPLARETRKYYYYYYYFIQRTLLMEESACTHTRDKKKKKIYVRVLRRENNGNKYNNKCVRYRIFIEKVHGNVMRAPKHKDETACVCTSLPAEHW